MTTIRSVFHKWPKYNQALIDAVARLSPAQLAYQPSPDRWPLWATAGHLCCQRVSGMCGEGGEPGAESTPFPDALYRCPGDEYLEPVMDAGQLADALRSTFAIIEKALDTWTLEMLVDEIQLDFGDGPFVRTRGSIIQGSFAHDLYHAGEINENLSRQGMPLADLWS